DLAFQLGITHGLLAQQHDDQHRPFIAHMAENIADKTAGFSGDIKVSQSQESASLQMQSVLYIYLVSIGDHKNERSKREAGPGDRRHGLSCPTHHPAASG